MDKLDQVMDTLKSAGITEHDALVIADCILTRKSCSWINTDPVDERMVEDLNDVIASKSYGVKVLVQPIPTRSKYIWEVKIV